MNTDKSIKPATPLPWETSSNAKGQWDVCAEDAGNMVADLAGMRKTGPEDSAYIVHSANAYPRLIEVLRNIMNNEWDANNATSTGKSIRALLTELGEK